MTSVTSLRIGVRIDAMRLSFNQTSTAVVLRSVWALASCCLLIVTAQAEPVIATPSQPQQQQRRGWPNTRVGRLRQQLQEQRHGHTALQTHVPRVLQTYAWVSTRAGHIVLSVRGGQEGNGIIGNNASEQSRYVDTGVTSSKQESNAAVEKMEKIAADLRSKRDDIAADLRAKRDDIAADLKAKQEKITDEVLRDRSPEALGELGGHQSSYDSATAVGALVYYNSINSSSRLLLLSYLL